MHLNTQEILNSLTGRAVKWAENHVKIQKEKYGNEGIFEAIIDPEEITFFCGESQGIFKYNEFDQQWELDRGNLYHPKQCQTIVNQLAKKFLQDENTEYCKPQTLRYKVCEFIMSDPNLCRFRGEQYFEVEDALVDFINNLK